MAVGSTYKNHATWSDRSNWDVDFLQLRDITFRESSVRLMKMEAALDVQCVTMAKDEVLWAVFGATGTVGTISLDMRDYQHCFEWDGSQQITDLAYDPEQTNLLMLDAPSGQIWRWNASRTIPLRLAKLTSLAQTRAVESIHIGCSLPVWSRMAVWSPDDGPEAVLSGAPGGLLRVPLYDDGPVRPVSFRGDPELVAALTRGPIGIAIDPPNGLAVIACPSAHGIVLCDLESGEVVCAAGGIPGDSGDGEPARAARLMEPADVVLFHYGDKIERKFLTQESVARLTSAAKEGTDRCVLIADPLANRVRKWARLGTADMMLPLIGGGNYSLITGGMQQNLFRYAIPAPVRLSFSRAGQLAITTDDGTNRYVIILKAASTYVASSTRDDDSDTGPRK